MFTLIFIAGTSYGKIGKIKVNGSIEVQGRCLNNSTDLADYDSDKAGATGKTDDVISDVITRVLVGVEAKITEGVSGRILLRKNDRNYGTGSQSIFGTEWNVNIENAYLVLDDFLKIFKITLGRQFLGEEGDLNLYYGPTSGDALGVNAIDGIKADVRIKKFDISLLNFKIVESGLVPSRDIDLSGITVSCGGRLVDGLNTKLYIYQRIDKSAGGQSVRDDLRVYGLKGSYEVKSVEGLKVKAEYAFNAGTDNNTDVNYEGSAYIIGASYRGVEVADIPLSFKLEYASGSGDDSTTATKQEAFRTINSDLRYGTIWANSLGNVGLNVIGTSSGLSVLNLCVGAERVLFDELSAKLDYLTFTANEVTGGASDDWGSEIDLTLNWKQSKDVSLQLILAQLSPGDALKNNLGVTTSDAITKVVANLKVNF